MLTLKVRELLKQKIREEGLHDVLLVWDSRFRPFQNTTRPPYTVVLNLEKEQAEIRIYNEYGLRSRTLICLTEEEALEQTMIAVRNASRELDEWHERIIAASKRNE